MNKTNTVMSALHLQFIKDALLKGHISWNKGDLKMIDGTTLYHRKRVGDSKDVFLLPRQVVKRSFLLRSAQLEEVCDLLTRSTSVRINNISKIAIFYASEDKPLRTLSFDAMADWCGILWDLPHEERSAQTFLSNAAYDLGEASPATPDIPPPPLTLSEPAGPSAILTPRNNTVDPEFLRALDADIKSRHEQEAAVKRTLKPQHSMSNNIGFIHDLAEALKNLHHVDAKPTAIAVAILIGDIVDNCYVDKQEETDHDTT